MRRELTEMIERLGIGSAETMIVRKYQAALEGVLQNFIDDFYKNLFANGHGKTFQNVDVQRLKMKQLDHWHRLFEVRLDDVYANHVTRIGVVHRERNIVPQVYIQSYGWFTSRLVEDLGTHPGIAAADRPTLAGVVLKLIFLDMTLALASYDAALVD